MEVVDDVELVEDDVVVVVESLDRVFGASVVVVVEVEGGVVDVVEDDVVDVVDDGAGADVLVDEPGTVDVVVEPVAETTEPVAATRATDVTLATMRRTGRFMSHLCPRRTPQLYCSAAVGARPGITGSDAPVSCPRGQ